MDKAPDFPFGQDSIRIRLMSWPGTRFIDDLAGDLALFLLDEVNAHGAGEFLVQIPAISNETIGIEHFEILS